MTTFTESDFSRTFQPTTGDGSDHAWGSHHMVMGGAVQGGQIYGQFPTFQLGGPNDTDTRGRWIPTTVDRSVRRDAGSWFGIPATRAAYGVPESGEFRGTADWILWTDRVVSGSWFVVYVVSSSTSHELHAPRTVQVAGTRTTNYAPRSAVVKRSAL